jgi:hypothetical protein
MSRDILGACGVLKSFAADEKRVMKPGWQMALANGERVRPVFTTASFFALGCMTAGAVFCLLIWLLLVTFWATGRRSGLIPSDAFGIALTAICGVGFICVSVWIWSLLLRTAIQLSTDHFNLWDWRGREQRFEYQWVRAISWRYGQVNGPGRRDLRALYALPGSTERWGDLGANRGWRTDFAEVVKDELIRHCGVTEPRPIPGWPGSMFRDWERTWVRPGTGDLPPLPPA